MEESEITLSELSLSLRERGQGENFAVVLLAAALVNPCSKFGSLFRRPKEKRTGLRTKLP